MGHSLELNTPFATVGAYLAEPAGQPKGGLVVIQEIFGVNTHIRNVADRYAGAGYTAIAPAFFDPIEFGVELGYDEPGFARGRELVAKLGLDRAVEIVAAAAKAVATAGKTGTVGYCWGGTVALLAAQRLGLPSVSYYGARNAPFLDQPAKAPVMFHFGEKDPSIPPEVVAQHREKLPQMEVYTYPASHAFNRDVDPKAYHAASAQKAWERTLAFFDKHLAPT
ncbi:dienelactone hydrolase family protein [Frateuria defendens]|uniref:dienelactone hydrolase family protein n=1 Tax=Frateuria defendens TaxID=2219559 RepID=UPI00066FF229|nr:dienelactone hydrolase family protein [Frateuria defendens]